MKSYLDIVDRVLKEGRLKQNRTGVKARSVLGAIFRHDMSVGFPLLTTKKMAFNSIKVELEGFIRGITTKEWYQERGCHIWDEWQSPYSISIAKDRGVSTSGWGMPNEYASCSKKQQDNELGPIYGAQWRGFNSGKPNNKSDGTTRDGIDQLAGAIKTLKDDTYSRRIIVTAWNPFQNKYMALPPCHFAFQLIVDEEDKLNLTWFQRSADLMLGVPFNIASYGLLLHLIAKEVGLKEGSLIGMFNDVHIYENHIDGAQLQLERQPNTLPAIVTEGDRIFDWDHTKTTLLQYESWGKIKFEVAV